MNTKAPPTRTLLTLVAFLVACISLALYLWLAFGGTTPFQPQGYRMRVEFPDATGLQTDADVRIAGVNVGKVLSTQIDPKTEQAVAIIQVDSQFAPRPADTRAILRAKTLLGEVYVELSPGSASAAKLPDGGALAAGQVQRTATLDELLRTFDPATRRALTAWLTEQGAALRGGAVPLSSLLAVLDPLATSGGQALHVLRRQNAALTGLIRNGGEAIGGLTAGPDRLRALVQHGDAAFRATAAESAQLAATVRALPSFLDQTRLTTARIAGFAHGTLPLVRELEPAARRLAPAVSGLAAIAPSLRTLLAGLGPLEQRSRAGIPALERALDESVPLLRRLKPYLGSIVPVAAYATRFRREITGAVANVTAASQATLPPALGGTQLHYVRGSLPVNLEALAPLPFRFADSRSNPYPLPGTATDLARGLSTFGSYLCVSRPFPTLSSAIPATLRKTIQDAYFTSDPTGPPCRSGTPLGTATGSGGSFPRLTALP